MKRHSQYTGIALALLPLIVLAGCGKSDAPAEAPKPDKTAAVPKPEEENPKLFVPDACGLLTADSVTSVSGWKSAKVVPVSTGAEYLSACDIVDGADATHTVKIAVAIGAEVPIDSLDYAKTVGDRSGTLKTPAAPINTLGVPTIEMDGGPGAQSMQTRMNPFTELTITTPSMQLTRTLFPQALIKLRGQLVKDS